MFKKIFNVLALTLASQSVFARYKMAKQCQMVNNLIHKTDAVESCCFFDRVVCDSEMRNVIQLNLSNLDLTYVDEDVFKLPLIALDLSGNKDLKEIPKEISNLDHLEILNISDLPNLTKLPDTITLLKNLNILMLNNDIKLKQLPVNIGNLTKLNQFYATSSGLESLPASIVNLKKLVILNVSSSKDLAGEVPSLPEDVICDYSETNICHIKDVQYPAKWSLPHDIHCEKINVNPAGNAVHMTDTNAAAVNVADEEGDNEEEEDENEEYRCGEKYGPCPNNGCCSKWGYCGVTDAHCKIESGCNPQYGLCYDKDNKVVEPAETTTTPETPKPTTTTETEAPKTSTTTQAPKVTPDGPENYRCGKGYGSCGRGKCCSKYGWCGTSEEFCSASTCQKNYGVCWSNSQKPSTTTQIKKVPGRCGSLYGPCPAGYCCSKYGWCGTSESYCAAGKCQPEYGTCSNVPVNDNIIRDDGRCGEGYGRCAPGTCCSKYGWCGTADIFCKASSGCQSKYGFCKA